MTFSLWHGVINCPLERPIIRPATRPTMAQIAAIVAAKHGITVEDLKGDRRRRREAIPRQEAMWRIRQETDKSLPAIGRFFGGRDHSTVWHNVRVHERRVGGACADRAKV